MDHVPGPSSPSRRRLRWLTATLLVVLLLLGATAAFVSEPPAGPPPSFWLPDDVRSGEAPYADARGAERLGWVCDRDASTKWLKLKPASPVARATEALGAWIRELRGDPPPLPHSDRCYRRGERRIAGRDEWVSIDELLRRALDRAGDHLRELERLRAEASTTPESELDRALGWRCGTSERYDAADPR